MADSGFSTPVALGIQTPDMFGKLSQILEIRAQQQGLAKQAAEVQQTQQTTRQRAAMATVDWDKHTGEDGTLDLNSIGKDPSIRRAAGDSYPDVLQQAAQIKQAQTAAKESLLNLNGSQVAAFGSTVGGLANDEDVVKDTPAGRAKVQNAFQQFAQTYGPDAAKAVAPYAAPLQGAPPGKLGAVVQHIQLQANDAGRQLDLQKPQYTNTGSNLQQTNPYTPGAQPPPQNIPLTVGPGAIIVRDAHERQFVLNPQTNTLEPVGTGRPAPMGGAPGNGPDMPNGAPGQQPPGQPSARPSNNGSQFAQPVPGQQQVMSDIDTARKAGAQVGTNRYMNSELMRLSRDTATGPGTEIWHNAVGAFGAPFGASANADYQLIGAFLDRQAAMNSEAMGLPNTNAGLHTSQSLSGNTTYSPGALQAKVRLNDALNTAADQYRQGLDKAIGTGNNPDLGAYQRFRSAWSTNFDPRVFAMENAIRDGDTEEQHKIQKDLKPGEGAALYRKRAALMALVKGQVPQ